MITGHRIALAAALVASGGVEATAQPPAQLGPPTLTPSTRPVTSPYLNLAAGFEGVGGPTYQYFRLIRPEVDLRRANTRLGNELRDVRRQLELPPTMAQSPASALGTTGHPTAFQSTGTFYPTRRRWDFWSETVEKNGQWGLSGGCRPRGFLHVLLWKLPPQAMVALATLQAQSVVGGC
jgi:hypothetical protein